MDRHLPVASNTHRTNLHLYGRLSSLGVDVNTSCELILACLAWKMVCCNILFSPLSLHFLHCSICAEHASTDTVIPTQSSKWQNPPPLQSNTRYHISLCPGFKYDTWRSWRRADIRHYPGWDISHKTEMIIGQYLFSHTFSVFIMPSSWRMFFFGCLLTKTFFLIQFKNSIRERQRAYCTNVIRDWSFFR